MTSSSAPRREDRRPVSDPWSLQHKILALDLAKPAADTGTDALGRKKRAPRDEARFICKLILMKLAVHANADGVAWPSTKSIAETVGCDVRTVQRHVGAMCEAGLISRQKRMRSDDPAVQTSNRYRLHPENWSEAAVAEYHSALRLAAETPTTSVSHRGSDSIESPSPSAPLSHPAGDSIEPDEPSKRNKPGSTTQRTIPRPTTGHNVEHEPFPQPRAADVLDFPDAGDSIESPGLFGRTWAVKEKELFARSRERKERVRVAR